MYLYIWRLIDIILSIIYNTLFSDKPMKIVLQDWFATLRCAWFMFHPPANSRHRQADRNSLCDKAGAVAVEPPALCQMCWALGGQLGADCLGIRSSLQVAVRLLSETQESAKRSPSLQFPRGVHQGGTTPLRLTQRSPTSLRLPSWQETNAAVCI